MVCLFERVHNQPSLRKDLNPYPRWAIYIPLPVTSEPCKAETVILKVPSRTVANKKVMVQ